MRWAVAGALASRRPMSLRFISTHRRSIVTSLDTHPAPQAASQDVSV